MASDKDIILTALQKERAEYHEKIMQLDKIIRKIKGIDPPSDEDKEQPILQIAAKEPVIMQQPLISNKTISKASDIKVAVLRIFDLLGKASKLKEVQAQYYNLTGNQYSVREIVRSLNYAKLVKMVRLKDNNRGILWVKTEWIENGELLDQFKPDGFDMFYKAENLIYE